MRTALPIATAVFAVFLAGAASAGGMAPSHSASPQLALLFHGNYCGPGNRGPDVPPVDALDTACMHHDACTPSDALPGCSCHAHLRIEANGVAMDRRQSDDVRALAGLVAQGSQLLACKTDAASARNVSTR